MNRQLAMAGLLAFALITSGCVQAVTGDTITFEAEPATVNGQTLEETGFKLNERDQVTANRTVEIPVLGERDVRIRNHVRVYSPVADEQEAEQTDADPVVMFLVSTPQAEVAGQPANPLGRVPLEELVTRVASQGGSFNDLEKVEDRDVDTLGKTSTVEKYTTTLQRDGRSVETFVYVTRVPHEGDYVISVTLVPKPFADDEETVFTLIENLEHSGDN